MYCIIKLKLKCPGKKDALQCAKKLHQNKLSINTEIRKVYQRALNPRKLKKGRTTNIMCVLREVKQLANYKSCTIYKKIIKRKFLTLKPKTNIVNRDTRSLYMSRISLMCK